MTGIYALVHLAVDLSCAFLIYSCVLGGESWYLWLLVYNFCAFAMQMPIGAMADRLNRNSLTAMGGCIGVFAGLVLGTAGFPAAACIAAGLGNACFHVGGGIDVLNRNGSRAAPLGIFIAPGAFGIYLGRILGGVGRGSMLWIGGLMLLSAAAIRIAAGRSGLWQSSGNEPVSYELPDVRKIYAAACLLAAVILRSYVGSVQDFPWKGVLSGSGIILTGALVLGKMTGGILADEAGIRKTAFYSMLTAAVGFLLLIYPVTGILAVFCFNMSMPLTLWAVSRIFPGAKGFGFGLLTFGLFLGFCPVFLSGGEGEMGTVFRLLSRAGSSPAGLAFMAVVSLFLLGFGLKRGTA